MPKCFCSKCQKEVECKCEEKTMIGQDIDIDTKNPIGEPKQVKEIVCKCEKCGCECECSQE